MCRKLEAFEILLFWIILKIPWTNRVINGKVLRRMNKKREVLTTIDSRKLQFFGHIMQNESRYAILQAILQGKIFEKRGPRRRRTSAITVLGVSCLPSRQRRQFNWEDWQNNGNNWSRNRGTRQNSWNQAGGRQIPTNFIRTFNLILEYENSLINTYATTNDKPEEIKEQFFEDLEQSYRRCPKNDIKILLGDMNARIGRERVFMPTIGKHSLHNVSSDNGLRLINLAAALYMTVASTYFENTQEFQIRTPTILEVKDAVKKLARNKSPGIDNLPAAELYKESGHDTIMAL
ncbi:unnamed protein product [Diabrotica balteata]|uniref:Craniofacial development protein 2-like n=1 Tax=Diabrotica balteata TaxID=107213 RepID=A0A9N9XE60_DIABA|nr:unnamed protein product [Diabrotica balteata]